MSTGSRFCPDCGAQNDRDAIFCSSCGKKFDTISQGLGQTSQPQANPASYEAPQAATPSGVFAADQGQNFNASNQDVELINQLDASQKFIREPKKYGLRLLSDPNAPSGTPLILIRVLLVGVISYLEFVKDDYFNAINRDLVETQLETVDLSVEAARGLLTISTPVFSIIYSLGVWWIGSIILGILVKRSLHRDSPLMIDASYSMRQLNAYRQIPRIIVEGIALLVILTSPVGVYLLVTAILYPLAEIGFALILYRGLGEHVGYFGSIHKIIAGLIILGVVFPLIF